MVEEPGVTEVIEFRSADNCEQQAELAKELFDQGLLLKQVAAEMKCSRSKVNRLMKLWSAIHQEQIPHGSVRRKTLAQKGTRKPLHQRLADQVMKLWQEDILLQDIAKQLSCGCHTVSAAIRHWHESRGLVVPDGRTRRKTLTRKRGAQRSANAD
jgi:hypothetical protein